MNSLIKKHFFKSKLNFKQCNSFVFLIDNELENILYARLFFKIFLELFPDSDCYLVLDKKYHFLYADFNTKLNIIESENISDLNLNLVISFNVSQARVLHFRNLLQGPFLAIGTENVAVKDVYFFPIHTVFHPSKLFFKCFDLFGISINTILSYIQPNKEKQLNGSVLIDVDTTSIELSNIFEQDSELKGYSFVTSSKQDLDAYWNAISRVDCVVTDNLILATMASVRGLFVVGSCLSIDAWGGPFINVKDRTAETLKAALLRLLLEDYDQPLNLPDNLNKEIELSKTTLFFGQAESDFADYLVKENIFFYSNMGVKEYVDVLKGILCSRYSLVIVGQISGDIVSFLVFNSLVCFLRCICFFKRINIFRVHSEFELKYKLAIHL